MSWKIPGNSLAIALLLAVMAHDVIREAGRTNVFDLACAVAPVVVGVLWVFSFSSPMGVISFALKSVGIQWNRLLNSNHAMTRLWLQRFREQIS